MSYKTSEIAAVLENAYLSADDIRKIAPVSRKQAYQLVKEIVREMEAEGLPKMSARPTMVPRRRVLNKLGLTTHELTNVR